MGKYDSCCKCTKSSCELCSFINASPIDVEGHGAKLLTVKVKIDNVCIGKKVAVACIIYDECNKIVAFKGFITMACEDDKHDKDFCGTIERKIVFVIPEEDCEPLELHAHTISNYIYPCESKK